MSEDRARLPPALALLRPRQWYKNVLATPTIRLAAAGNQYATDAVPVRDAGDVAQILDAFRAKYGARDVASYYPNPNAAVEVTL